MRRLLAITAGLGLLSTAAYADFIDITPYAGYTTVNLGQVKRGLDQLGGIDLLEVQQGGPGTSLTDTQITGAWIVGGDLLSDRITPMRRLSLGLRSEYLATNRAEESFFESNGKSWSVRENGTLSSLLLGARYQLPGANHGLSVSVGAFAGLGYATIEQDWSENTFSVNNQNNGLYQGEGFVGDLDFRLDWAIPGARWLHLDAQAGYRYASLGDLGSHGKPLVNPENLLSSSAGIKTQNNAEPADFGGFSAGGGFSVKF